MHGGTSIYCVAHVLDGEPVPTSPGHALVTAAEIFRKNPGILDRSSARATEIWPHRYLFSPALRRPSRKRARSAGLANTVSWVTCASDRSGCSLRVWASAC